MAKAGSVIIVATSERHSNARVVRLANAVLWKTTKAPPLSPYLAGFATIRQEIRLAFKPVIDPKTV